MKKSYDNSSSSDEFGSKEYSSGGSKNILSKYDYDLFDEEKDITAKVVRIKRSCTAAKEEKWKIMIDSKLVFTIEGSKISKSEKEFLRTVDGVNFLISQYKDGIKSLNSLREEIKSKLNKSG